MYFFRSVRVVTLGVLGLLGFAPLSSAEADRALSETVSLAIQTHPAFASQALNIEQQAFSRDAVSSEFNPQIKLSAGIGKEESSNSATRARGGIDTATRTETSLTLSQLIYDGNQLSSRLSAEETALAAVKLESEDQRSEVILNAITSHIELYRAQSFERFARLNVDAHEKIAEGVRSRVKSGKDDSAKSLQVEARLSLAKAEWASAQNEKRAARAIYLARTGVEVNLVGAVARATESSQGLPDSVSDYEQAVLANNVAMAALVQRERAAVWSLEASKNTNLPRVYIDSGASWNDNVDGVLGRSRDLYAMLRMDLDLYQGGRKQAVKESERVRRESIVLAKEELALQLKSEASQLWYTYQAQSDRLKFLNAYVASSQATRDAYQKQFKIGRRTLVGLLDAESEVLSAQRQALAAQSSLILTSYQMLHLESKLLSALGVSL